MTTAQAGWYPDPAGDATKLRYWDGAQWTEYLADAQPPAGVAGQADGNAGCANAPAQGYAANMSGAAAGYNPVADYAAAPGYGANPGYPSSGYAPAPNLAATPGSPAVPGYGGYAGQPMPQATYPVEGSDKTLRMVAFIFSLISTVATCWLIIPLAWMIPMSVHAWGIYKGTKANTTAYGVCTLIFQTLVGGICLLISRKDQ